MDNSNQQIPYAPGSQQPSYNHQTQPSHHTYQGQTNPWPAPDNPQPYQPPTVGGMFERRIGRLGFLLGLLYGFSLYAVYTLLLFILAVTHVLPKDPGGAGLAVFNLFVIIMNIASLLFAIVIMVSVVVRRLHDLNLPGPALLLYFVPLVNIALLFYLFFARGKEPNKHGPAVKSLNYWVVLGFRKPLS